MNQLNMDLPISNMAALDRIRDAWLKQEQMTDWNILICAGAGCISCDCMAVKDEIGRASCRERV